jgi:hypothetical protein
VNRLHFRFRSAGLPDIQITLVNTRTGKEWHNAIRENRRNQWIDATVDFTVSERNALADELRFTVANSAERLVDDVLLFEPGVSG